MDGTRWTVGQTIHFARRERAADEHHSTNWRADDRHDDDDDTRSCRAAAQPIKAEPIIKIQSPPPIQTKNTAASDG